MNTKNNRRKRESMRKIEQVLTELLQTKELNQISVSDLCGKADINRSTFYANYTDIYGLADVIREKLENQIAMLYREEITQCLRSRNYQLLFRHIGQNQYFYKIYFKLDYGEKYKILQEGCNFAGKHSEGRFAEYHREFFKSGLAKIIRLWLQDGCRETPEEMSAMIESEYRGRAEPLASG